MAAFLGGVYATDSGMLCVWNPDSFASVIDYDTWEPELCEDKDIRRHIKAGSFVPVGIHHGLDGAFGVHVRVGDADQRAELTKREAKYVLGQSDAYRLRSSGQLCLSGLEHVAGQPGHQVGCIPIPEGEYAVRIFLLAWDDEPGMKDRRGRPKPGALPDFAVLANPKKGRIRFRQKIHALDPPK